MHGRRHHGDPRPLFALLIVTALGANAVNALIAIGIAFAPGMARIAIICLGPQAGLRERRCRARRIEPLHRPLRDAPERLRSWSRPIRVAFAVMTLATLSFLGLGAQPRPPVGPHGLGGPLYLFRNPWMMVWPGLTMPSSPSGSTYSAMVLRDALDRGPTGTPFLSVEGYSLDYATLLGAFRALDDIRLAVARGEVLGLVGESGSGKTSLAYAVMRSLPVTALESGGAIRLGGEDLRRKSPSRSTASAAGASVWCSRTPAPRSTRP